MSDQGWEDDWDDDEGDPDDVDDLDDPDDDWRDDDDDREPDPEDAEIARADEEYWDHRDQAHGGGECDCGPGPIERLRSAVRRFRSWRYRGHGYTDEPPF